HIADRVAVMYLGRIVEIGTVDDVFARPAHHYTSALLAAQPGRHRRRNERRTRERRAEISVPELQASGCPFRDRCPAAADPCGTTAPPFVDLGNGHRAACHFPKSAPERLPPAVVD